MRILVTGGRDFSDKPMMWEVLDHYKIDEIIHGGAHGADALAREYAIAHGITETAYPANWQLYGKSAGPIRNTHMLLRSNPDLVLAFPGGKGTENMVKTASHYGYMVVWADY